MAQGNRRSQASIMRNIAKRILLSVPLLLMVSIIVFALIHAAPGGPVEMFLANPNVRPEDIERLRRSLGLDQPLPIQYGRWLWGFVTGEWGYSFSDGRPVTMRILERIPATLELIATAIGLSVVVALGAGTWSAVRHGTWFDRVATATSFAGISLPVFWFGLALQLVFGVLLGWLPSSGRSGFADPVVIDRLRHLILPATVLAALHAAAWSRFVRSSMLTALSALFIKSAHARGISNRRVVIRHALRTALLPFMTVVFLDAAIMVSGAVVTESVFAWPGLGSLFTDALARRDYTVLMAFLMITSTAVIALNLLADVTYRVLDPRVTE